MYVALGFCTAGLIGLAILPAFYRRAARLTEEALRAVNPSSYAEVRAAQDQARARHAVELRRVERQLEGEREKAAKFHLDASSIRQEIEAIKNAHEQELADLNAKIAVQEGDEQALDLLSAEVKTLKQKLSEAEAALAQSWAETAEDRSDTKSATLQNDDTDWMPATDTMALATITGLESEVATLKARLSKYEPVVASEIEASREETARADLAKLEAQLVDTESRYVSAQAEVTRLSLLLETANVEEAGREKHMDGQLEKLTSLNAKYLDDLESKERAVQRLTGQIKKLQKDLSETPQLADIRKDLQDLTARISKSRSTPASGKKDSKKIPLPVTVEQNLDVSVKRTGQRPAAARTKRSAASANQSKPTPANSEAPASKTSDIANAAEALVSRIVASNRSQEKPKRNKSQIVAATSKTEPNAEASVPGKQRSAKQNKKDVA